MNNPQDFRLLIQTPLNDLLPLQEASVHFTAGRHLLPGESIDGMRRRLSTALAGPEAHPGRWEEVFYRALHYAYPGNRIMAQLGAPGPKPRTTMAAFCASRTIGDSIVETNLAAREAHWSLRQGSGVGFDFSTLRPKGAPTSDPGAAAFGPLPFLDAFNALSTIAPTHGGRHAHNMAALAIHHPDIEAFIAAKRTGGLRHFKLSVLITDDFLDAVLNDWDFPLYFPASPSQVRDGSEIVWRSWPLREASYTVNDGGETACWIYRTVRARDLWSLIMRSTYESSDLGFVCIDECNRSNPLWWMENIRTTNPSGESGLPPHGACLPGSINLAALVRNPFTPSASFDWKLYAEIVRVFSRALDNAVDLTRLSLPEQRQELIDKRRHGLGYMGLGSAMTMLGMRYGSEASIGFTRGVSRVLGVESWRAGLELGREKGSAPALQAYYELTPEILRRQPQLRLDGFKAGQRLRGSVLHARYSEPLRRIASVDPALVRALMVKGSRYTHGTALGPAGPLAFGVGNNVSRGIEPSYAHHYTRYLTIPGEAAKRAVPVLSYELLAYKSLFDPNVDLNNLPAPLRITAAEADPIAHVDVQAAAQTWIDLSVSKTIPVSTNVPLERFQDLYHHAFDSNLKSFSTFRFNPAIHRDIVVHDEGLETTDYEFRQPDGALVRVRDDDSIENHGQRYTVADLLEALKSGVFDGCRS